jgi:hypothetical protein
LIVGSMVPIAGAAVVMVAALSVPVTMVVAVEI